MELWTIVWNYDDAVKLCTCCLSLSDAAAAAAGVGAAFSCAVCLVCKKKTNKRCVVAPDGGRNLVGEYVLQ